MELLRINLEQYELPKFWYNITADLPNKLAPALDIHGNPASLDDMAKIFPHTILEQEVATARYVEIPEEVRRIYAQWRPIPLCRARRLEEILETPAKIYYKYEGMSAAGSHKPNSAIPQAYYNKLAGVKRLTTETGAGQWGASISYAGQMFGLPVRVYMVRVSYDQKVFRRSTMTAWGSEVIASPSELTKAGRDALAADKNCRGSLGLAISEAVEDAINDPNTCYTLGSVMNHVCMHQTVMGLECKKQLAKIDEYPDIVIGACGGGSSFSGIAFPFLGDKLYDEPKAKNLRCIAVEPTSCPSLTKGVFTYDFGDASGYTPLMKMYTLGHDFMPPGIHAGGLRYHGCSPIIAQLYNDKMIEAVAVPQLATFDAGVQFARAEGIIPAPESCHAIRVAIDEALKCKQSGEAKTILFCLTGHGHFDMLSYERYFSGELENYDYPQEAVQKSLEHLPKIEK